jgi:hypothetical protein
MVETAESGHEQSIRLEREGVVAWVVVMIMEAGAAGRVEAEK